MAVILTSMILRLIIADPQSDLIITLSILILAILYFVFGYSLINGIGMTKAFKKDQLSSLSGLKKTGGVLTGFLFSFLLIGILFKFQRWPGGSYNLMVGLIGLIPVLIIVVAKLTKTQSDYYKQLLTKIALIGTVSLILFFTSEITLLEIKNRDYPEYVKAEKELMQDPMNKALQENARRERMKMIED